ncbi:MAG: hypothetical protein J6A80_06545, partial [Lachnospiraceae bacterium]|nr:hypothetical protein [Lachnospiraceae bacterium]
MKPGKSKQEISSPAVSFGKISISRHRFHSKKQIGKPLWKAAESKGKTGAKYKYSSGYKHFESLRSLSRVA